MSTVISPDGTIIDYDRYGDGPAVVFIAGAAAYRAIDECTTRRWRRSGTTGAGAAFRRHPPWALDLISSARRSQSP